MSFLGFLPTTCSQREVGGPGLETIEAGRGDWPPYLDPAGMIGWWWETPGGSAQRLEALGLGPKGKWFPPRLAQ